MSKLTRNYGDADSRSWWEAAEKAGVNQPKLVMLSSVTEEDAVKTQPIQESQQSGSLQERPDKT